jgi:hypothetical protein
MFPSDFLTKMYFVILPMHVNVILARLILHLIIIIMSSFDKE